MENGEKEEEEEVVVVMMMMDTRRNALLASTDVCRLNEQTPRRATRPISPNQSLTFLHAAPPEATTAHDETTPDCLPRRPPTKAVVVPG